MLAEASPHSIFYYLTSRYYLPIDRDYHFPESSHYDPTF